MSEITEKSTNLGETYNSSRTPNVSTINLEGYTGQ